MALFKEEVEDEDRDKWIVYFDGVSNALGHRVGEILATPDDQCIPFMARLGFACTNNMAEYEACALRIQAAIDFKVKLLKVYGDSALVIHQLRGEWETRDHKLIPYQAYIKKLTEFFDDISFHHIPREENQMVDALATLASMFQLTPHGDLPYIEFRCCGKPIHCCLIEDNLGTSTSSDTLKTKSTCHTLISSEDHCLMACNLRLTASRNLTPIVKLSIKFRDMSGVERNLCLQCIA